MPAGVEDKPVEAKGEEYSVLDWLIKPLPNSQEGNGLPGAVGRDLWPTSQVACTNPARQSKSNSSAQGSLPQGGNW